MTNEQVHTFDTFFQPSGKLGRRERQRLNDFYDRFCVEMGEYYGEGHWILLAHAAFPVVITPDLLYKIWMNFRVYPDKDNTNVSQVIPYVAVSDILVSGICREVGFEQYEISTNIRFALLEWLKQDRRFCEKLPEQAVKTEEQSSIANEDLYEHKDRIRDLAEFLSAYLKDGFKGNDAQTKAYREGQEWAITTYLQPDQAIRKLYNDYLDANTHNDKRKKLQLNNALEQLRKQYSFQVQVNPNEDQLEKIEQLLTYSQGTKSLLMGNEEQAIAAFRKLEPLKRESATQIKTVKKALSFPAAIGGKSIRPEPGDSYDGEQIYALLVGIDEYQSKDIPQLSGCVNDIQAMDEYLREYHNEKDLRILRLTDKDATYENVITQFRQHFKKARSEDVILFYFTGHTSFFKTAPEFESFFPSGEEASFILHDSRVNPDEHRELSNLEFIALLAESVEDEREKYTNAIPPRVVVIIDTHYGKDLVQTPSSGVAQPKPSITRKMAPIDRRPLKSYLGGYYQEMFDREGAFSFPNIDFVLLAASTDKEMAKEMRGRGVFSYSMMETLQQYKGEISYENLLSHTKIKVENRVQDQTPLIEIYGDFDAKKGFLDKELKDQGQETTIQVFYHKERRKWMLNAGVLHGFEERGRILVPLDDELSADFRISTVELSLAELEEVPRGKRSLGPESVLDKEQIYEIPFSESHYRLEYVYAEETVRNILERLALNLGFIEVRKEANWVISENRGIWKISPPDFIDNHEQIIYNFGENYSLEQILDSENQEVLEKLREPLQQIAQWNWLANIKNSDTNIKDNEVELTIQQALDDDNLKELETRSGYLDLELDKDEAITLSLSLKNNCAYDVYVCVLILTSKFGIEFIANEMIPQGESISLHKKKLNFFLDQQYEEQEEYLRLIYSTEKINTSHLHKAGLVIPSPKPPTR